VTDNNIPKIRILLVQGAAQLINGISVLKYLNNKQSNGEIFEDILVISDVSDELRGGQSHKGVIEELLQTYKWKQVFFLDTVKLCSHFQGDLLLLSRQLKSIINTSGVSDLIFSRYTLNNVARALAILYPLANRTGVGDSFGLIGDTEIHSLRVLSFNRMLKRSLRSLRDFISRARYLKLFRFDIFVLTIPVYLKETFKGGDRVEVPERCFLLDTVQRASDISKSLNLYTDDLLKKFKGKSLGLVLLSNFYLSGMCEKEREIEMYRKIILNLIQEVDLLIVKPHPRSDKDMLRVIADEFDSRVHVMEEKTWSYPVEIMRNLILEAKVYTVYSTAPISIKYLYNIDAAFVLDSVMAKAFLQSNAAKYVIWINTKISDLVYHPRPHKGSDYVR